MWAVLNFSPVFHHWQCCGLPHPTPNALLRLSVRTLKCWNCNDMFFKLKYSKTSILEITQGELSYELVLLPDRASLILITYTSGPKCHSVYSTEEDVDFLSPFLEWLSVISEEGDWSKVLSEKWWLALEIHWAVANRAGRDYGGAQYQLTDREWRWEQGKASLHACACGHPPTLLTEGRALDVLSIRKTCPFPQWISAHLCPKTVPHAFLCMWTWQSSANHQQDVSFVFPMWWAIPTFTHFPCKNRTSPWLVGIRDVAVAKEKFSSVEVNPWVGLNPQTSVNSTVLLGQSP